MNQTMAISFLLFLLMQGDLGEVVLEGTNVFNSLTDETAARREDGAFFIFDRFEQQIFLFEPGQEEGFCIARKGSGPGELDRTNRIQFFNGQLLAFSASQIQIFDNNGTFLTQVRIPPSVKVSRTPQGWLGWHFGFRHKKLGLVQYDLTMNPHETIVEWMEDAPMLRRVTSGKPIEIPLFIERGNHVVSLDGTKVFYRLPHESKINIYSLQTNKILGVIQLEGRYPFDESRGEAEVARLKKDLPNTKIKPIYPEFFPYTNGMRMDPEGNLLVKRWMGKRAIVLRFDSSGTPLTNSELDFDQVMRVVAVEGDRYFISFQSENGEDMGISKVPITKALEFIVANPIE